MEDFSGPHETVSCAMIRHTTVIKFGRELGEDIYFEIRWKFLDLDLTILVYQPELL